ncbi:DEAD/DEAH box helicase [bacterium]|nr:DEAD/DEAH box helicase [bacterium]
MTYIPRGRASSTRNSGGNRRRNDGGRPQEGRAGGRSEQQGDSPQRGRGGSGGNGRSGRGSGPQRDNNRRHSGYGQRREPEPGMEPRRGGHFEHEMESQPRPEHVEFGNGARKPGMGRGRGRGRGAQQARPEYHGNRLPPEEKMLPDDYGNRIDMPERGSGNSRSASSQRAARPERPQRTERDARGGRGPRTEQPQGRSQRGSAPNRGTDYVDERPAPRYVDRDDRPQPDADGNGPRRRRSRGRRGRGGNGGADAAARGGERQGPGRGGPEPRHEAAAQATEGRTGRREPLRRERVEERGEREPLQRVANRRSRQKEEKLELDIIAFIRDNPVVHEIEDIFEPTHMFSDFGLSAKLLANVEKRGYEAPTPIQDLAIPSVKEGRDVVGLANTGTGKTAAFLLPLIDRMLADKSQYALVLAPTRELAIQIEEELQSFTIGLGMRSTVIVGGVGEGAQLKSLKADNRFIIATPGRLIDFLRRGELKLNHVNNVVLDEADRMLDMGFIRDMRYIIGLLPRERQTLFFSATMSEEIRGLIGDFLRNPVTVSVVRHKTSANVEQEVISMSGRKRFEMLVDLLRQPQLKRVLVFGRTKHGMNKLSKMLNREGLETDAIHGNKSHNARQLALKRFKEGSIQALVATDVAARGLDIDDVSHVINFELPQTYDDYIHRIGRTGRAGRTGHAITFIE